MAGTAGILLLAGIYLFGYEPPYRGILVARPARTLVFAHRGFGDLGPDNSLYAVEHALAAGMDGVDVDGQLTRDSELVIFHDLSVDRLTSGEGRVRDKTRAEMLALDLGPKYDQSIHGAYVRTFEDFVRSMKGYGILMVELKVPGPKPTGVEQRAVDIIRKYDAHRDVVLSSFNPLVLYRVKRLDAQVRTAFIFMYTNWNPELLAEIKPSDRVDLPCHCGRSSSAGRCASSSARTCSASTMRWTPRLSTACSPRGGQHSSGRRIAIRSFAPRCRSGPTA